MSGNSPGFRLVLLAHGSRYPTWRQPFERLADELTQMLPNMSVRLAYLEFDTPSLGEALEEASRDDVTLVRILPLFTAGGKHVGEDLPAAVEAARRSSSQTTFQLLPPLGEDPRFYALMRTAALEAAHLDSPTP
ncbi:MAG: sirohydrochlorin chelatase [Planctomycetota bacterium]|jgi:sirohydrochlorin cobaltochelatase